MAKGRGSKPQLTDEMAGKYQVLEELGSELLYSFPRN